MYRGHMENTNYCIECGQPFQPILLGDNPMPQEFCHGKVCIYWLIDQSKFDEREEDEGDDQ